MFLLKSRHAFLDQIIDIDSCIWSLDEWCRWTCLQSRNRRGRRERPWDTVGRAGWTERVAPPRVPHRAGNGELVAVARGLSSVLGDGPGRGREGTHACTWPIHFFVRQKPTQHWKQLYSNNKIQKQNKKERPSETNVIINQNNYIRLELSIFNLI